jgi:tRNA-Thr(GGU) m(6)t(6)A37 methyltransferase TsaA
METISVRPVGVLRTPYRSPAEAPIQGHFRPEARGEIEVFAEFAAGLADVEGFSHLTLLYYFHRAGEERLTAKPYLDEVERGVFATRAPWRPNHLGITTVRLLERRGNVLVVAGVDMLDATPLLDIKPYVPAFDREPDDVKCGWLEGKIGPGKRRGESAGP